MSKEQWGHGFREGFEAGRRGHLGRFSKAASVREWQEHSVTCSWHQPECSRCGRPIEQIGDAMAQWWTAPKPAGEGREHSHPAINCTGGDGRRSCAAAYWDEAQRCGLSPQDLPVHALRRSPMDAIAIAMRAKADAGDDIQHWVVWLSIVIGMPFNAWNSIYALASAGECADQMAMRLPLTPPPGSLP